MLDIWKKALELGVKEIPKKIQNHSGYLPWHDAWQRDFLIEYKNTGIDLFTEKRYVDALWIFTHLLELSPDDNQGARFMAVDCCLIIGKDIHAIEICNKYNSTHGPDAHLCYSKSIAMYSTYEVESVKEQIKKSISRFPVFGKLLAQKRKKSFYDSKDFKSPGYIGSEKEEAMSFWNTQGLVWERNNEFMELFRKIYNKN